jgi:hypothetical protein
MLGLPREGADVAEYRAFVVGSKGQILGRSDFKADDDAAALEYARKNVLIHPIEVWQSDRLVGTVHPSRKTN